MTEDKKNKLSDLFSGKKVFGYILIAAVIVVVIFFAFKELDNKSLAKSTAENGSSKTIRINEYVVRNKNTFRDENWQSPDWIELYNYGDEDIWLGDVYLSDDLEEPDKFQLPDRLLKAGEYLLVLASGKTDANDSFVRATFKLGEDDKNILIFCEDKVIDSVELEYIPTDISAGYSEQGEFGYFAKPTPNGKNTTEMSMSYDTVPINSYEGMLRINEYMTTSYDNVPVDSVYNSDWIEIYNPSGKAISLGDVYLSDDENELNKFRIPSVILGANEYIVVYATGEVPDATGVDIHAPFRLSEDDTKITLTHKSGHIIDQCDVSDISWHMSMGTDSDGNPVFYIVPTPGAENDSLTTADYVAIGGHTSTKQLVFNEWMTNNQFGIIDGDGDTSDWVEIYNPNDESVSLKGYALTDDIEKRFKWTFPDDASIPANGYIIVFASGKDKEIDGEIHTNFSLSEGETLYLIKPNVLEADSIEMEDLPGNVSKGKTDDGYGYYALPTPGAENTTSSTPQIDAGVDFLLGDIYISEVASSDYHYYKYQIKDMYEYIELHNSSTEVVDLSGYTIAKNGGVAYELKNTSIAPNEYLLLSLKGRTSGDAHDISESGLSLNSSGEELLLINKDEQVIDYFVTGYLLGDYSSGRIVGDVNSRVFFKEKTPGAENSTDIYATYSSKPVFSHVGGMTSDPILLALSASEDATIYYTLNGNIPTISGEVYSEPILIDEDTVVRAVAISPEKLPSQIENRTYILERTHEIPIVCITSPPAYLFYEEAGIYAKGSGYGVGEYPYFESNYFKDIERPISFEYYDENGQPALAFEAGVQIAGGYTRAVNQKSLVIRLRDEYGLSEVSYPFFDRGTSTFRHILLRNAGQDGWKTKIRDCFIQNSMMELGTVDMKRGRPVAVYINGDYWGLYNLRDKLNDEYLAIKYSLEQDQITLISEYSEAKKGDNEEWLALREFCQTSNMSLQENYDYLASQVDVQSFMDYIIAETFYGNVDTHNITFWKADVEGAKWRPLMFDMDLSIRGVDYSMVNMYMGRTNLGFHSHIIKSLAKNEGFQQEFILRYAYILNFVFTEEYFSREIGLLEDEIRYEMEYHVDRWNRPCSIEYWQLCMDVFKEGVLERRYEAVEEIEEYFELTKDEIYELFPWYKN